MSMEKTSIKPEAFLYKRPEYQQTLGVGANIALAMGALASRLVQEERTRTYHPDGRLENVAEHAYMLSKVARAMADGLYPWLDRGKVAIAAIDHDDVEAWVGDTPTDPVAKHDPRAKKELEEAGLSQLVHEYLPIAPRYVEDVVGYEKQEEYEDQFVRIVDKFMTLLIHIPNEGVTIREHYTYEEFVKNTIEKEYELLEQYPHWIELIEMRTELALYIGKKYIRDWHAT